MQRQVVSESRDRVATYREADSMKEEKVVAEHDTVMEVTTIHVRTNEAGDTVFRSIVTDRTRTRDRDKIAKQMTKTEVKTDTVYVERRDSVQLQDSGFRAQANQSGRTALHSTLKWIFWIILALIALTIVFKIKT
jgi:hypothetical protein